MSQDQYHQTVAQWEEYQHEQNKGGKMSVYKKLMQARIKLQSATLKKSGLNKFAGYSYFELADFLPTVQNIFADIGLCGVVSFTADLATLTIYDCDDATSNIAITSPMASAALKGCHEVQNVGAVETYQRRYLWTAAMEIVEHDALDSGEPVNPLIGALEAIANAQNMDKLKSHYVGAIKLLPESDHAVITTAKDKRKSELEKK